MQRKHNIKCNRKEDCPISVRDKARFKRSLSPNKQNKYLATGLLVFLVAFMATYIASAEFMGIGDTDAATSVNAAISSNGYYLNVTSLGEVNLDVNATASGGKGEGSDTVHVETNTAGYKLYIGTTNSSNNMYMNGDESSIYKLNPTSEGTELNANSWGYKLSGESSYKPVPVKGSEKLLVNQTGLTANQSNERNHSVIYGAKADMTLPAGRYSRTVTYSAMTDASAVANLASVSPDSVTRAASGTFVLTVSLPMMTNMDPGSWTVKVDESTCTNPNATKVDNRVRITCNAPSNLAAGVYTVTATSTNYGNKYTAKDALTYNANSALTANIFNISNMQDMSSSVCSATTKPNTSATNFDTNGSHSGDANYVPQTILKDTRDNKRYLIRKLADGNCWMAQNLELDILGSGQSYSAAKTSNTVAGGDSADEGSKTYFGTTVTSGVKFTKDDTDLNTMNEWTPSSVSVSTYATQAHNITTSNPEYAWKNNGSDGLRSYSYAGSNTNWLYAIKTGGGGSNTYSFGDSSQGQPYERRGNLYNWTAATLGSGLNINDNTTSAQNSICPKGWKLPGNSGSKSFYNLFSTTYGLTVNNTTSNSSSIAINDAPFNYTRTGAYYRSRGYINERTTSGRWWTDTASYGTNASHLAVWSGIISSQHGGFRGFGFAVRCVAR